MITVVLSLGSNLGDREEHLRQAVRGLGDSLLLVSGVYETPPWGDADQPAYFNAVALVGEEGRGIDEWLSVAQLLERDAHRQRDPSRRFGPRTLDVDLITATTAAGEPILSDRPELTLPHPRAHLRAFVLRPWIDIEPHGRLPGHGWLTDLLNAEPLASDALELGPRPDLALESDT